MPTRRVRTAVPRSTRATSTVDAFWFAPMVFTLLALAAYGHTLDSPFILDDFEAVTANPLLRAWRGEPPYEKETSLTGRPVVALTMLLNYAAGGTDPAGYHLANIAIHVVNAWLLFLLLRSTFLHANAARPFAERASLWALVVAAIWLVHPLQAEAVTYTTSRTELIMASCYLATLYYADRAWHAESHR